MEVDDEEFVEAALADESDGSALTLLQVAATKTGALPSCIQERNEASGREETPASTGAESGVLPAMADDAVRGIEAEGAGSSFPMIRGAELGTT